jgi:pyridoxal phosphate-dependent aminotransferase EpsN
MQLQPVFSSCRYYSHLGESISQQLFANGMCLPSGSNMTTAQQDRVIETLNSIGLR